MREQRRKKKKTPNRPGTWIEEYTEIKPNRSENVQQRSKWDMGCRGLCSNACGMMKPNHLCSIAQLPLPAATTCQCTIHRQAGK